MITKKQYMDRYGISKSKYVDEWVKKGYIPGVLKNESGELLFPDSARRPYTSGKISATTSAYRIRACIVKAAAERKHINATICCMTDAEFNKMTDELVEYDLISVRNEDGIKYYDSTIETRNWKDFMPSRIEKMILKTIESAAKGVASAILEKDGL